MARIFAVTNQKGGVGKTATAYNCAYGIASLGKRTLLISMDPSADSLEPYYHEDDKFEHTLVDVLLKKDFDPHLAIHQAKLNDEIVSNLFFIPTDITLSLEQGKLSGRVHKEKLLIKQLDKVKDDFDIIIIDCPPLLTEFTTIAIYSADFIIIPLRYERDAVKGLHNLFDTLRNVKDDQYYEYKILRTGYDARKTNTIKKTDSVLSQINIKERLFKTVIRQDEDINKAKLENQPVITYSPKARGTQDYQNFIKELLND